MTAARLSPAASLLRNSKLFALPPAVALPPPDPSSEPVPRSDTATTIYPTRAAIETPLTSLGRGDWGFKRPLPLKSTTKSGSPTVRLNKGIDTAEHIADFDSAADHVLTLKKFQELNQSIRHYNFNSSGNQSVHPGVFRRNTDNTTNVSASAPYFNQYSGVWPSVSPSNLQKDMPETLRVQSEDTATTTPQQVKATQKPLRLGRWRYDGPSLAQMSGLEMDRWLKTLDLEKKKAFREVVKQDLLMKKRRTHATKTRDEGTFGEIDSSEINVTEEEVASHMKKLRQQPKEFGPLLAKFLDLPQGNAGAALTGVDPSYTWEYGRSATTVSDASYAETGPPRMHPSAGLSYIHSDRWAQNHAVFGPQDQRQPVVARNVKIRARAQGTNASTLGVAGFIVEKEKYKGTSQQHEPAYSPQPGGQKSTIKLGTAEIDTNGALKLTVRSAPEYLIEGTKAVHNSMVKDDKVAALRPGRGSRVMQPLTRNAAAPITYRKREDLTSEASEEDLDFLGKLG